MNERVLVRLGKGGPLALRDPVGDPPTICVMGEREPRRLSSQDAEPQTYDGEAVIRVMGECVPVIVRVPTRQR